MKKSHVFLAGFVAGGISLVVTVALAVITFCCPALNPGLVNGMLFRPIKQIDEYDFGEELLGKRAKEVFFRSDDPSVVLNGRMYIQKDAKQIILYSHGQGGNMGFVAPKIICLLSTGASVFAYDYRGYGKSTGTPSIDGVIADAKAAYDYVLKNTKYKKKQIILYGESLGTGVTSELAQRVDCAGIVLDSGFISPEKIGKELFPIFELYPSSMFPQAFNNRAIVEKKNHPPILLMAGKLDGFIPCHHSQYLYDHAIQPTAIALFDKCGHAYFGPERTLFTKRLKEFMHTCADTVATGHYAVQTATLTSK